MSRISHWSGVLVLSALGAGTAEALVVRVPEDHATIQAGIDAAGVRDTVLVAPGVYRENLLIHSKWIQLFSHFMVDRDPEQIMATVIDGSEPASPDSGSVLRLIEAGDATVSGFTITGGTGTIWQDESDGLLYREGGGILCQGGTPRIAHNLILNNSADLKTGVQSAGGGAIRCGYGLPEISNNVIAYNSGRYGGGIVVFHAPAVIRNNIVVRNSGGSDYGGGGVWAASAAAPHRIENNTIVDNRSALDGGGILLWANGAELRNNIIWANRAVGSGPQIRLRPGAGSSVVAYCDVEGGFAGANIDTLPGFASPEFLLLPSSPCVDAGEPGAAYFDPEDSLAPGWARAPALGTTRNDMGAYGGPGAVAWPAFHSPGLALVADRLDFGTVEVGSTRTRWLHLAKPDFGVAPLDSVVVRGGNPADFVVGTSLPLLLGPLPLGAPDSHAVSWTPATYGAIADTLLLFHGDLSVANPLRMPLAGSAPGATGDVNLDGVMTASDIIYLLNFVFKSGPPPRPVLRSGDVNCDAKITSSDIIYMVNFVFKSGPAPCA